MYITSEQRALYRSSLISHYFNKQKIKDMAAVRRQINNMDDVALKSDYDKVIGN